jgi:aminomethyltransferase
MMAATKEAAHEKVRRTSLYEWHVAQGAKMVPFAGYDMPVQYPTGIIAEHNHTREKAGLFDVSHMGQIMLHGTETVTKFQKFIPNNALNLKPGQMRYTVLLNEWGGILDDLIMVKPEVGEDLWLVVNAGCKDNDLATLHTALGKNEAVMVPRDLIALQGPKAEGVMRNYVSGLDTLGFMQARWTDIRGMPVIVMRSGYTGEDGFEISVLPKDVETLVGLLMKHEDVKPIGLGARDTLRLEAGLPLYGHELTVKTTPVEACLDWVINKPRLSQGEYAGAAIIEEHLLNKAERIRAGFIIDERAPARDGTEICAPDGANIGIVTSGGFSPTLNQPIAMGYIDRAAAATGTKVNMMVRGRPVAAHVAPLPFVPHRYYRKL